MVKRWSLVIFAVTVLVFLSMSRIAVARNTQAMVAKADALWPQCTHPEKTKEAIRILEEFLAQDPNDVEAHWKLAQAHYWLGTHSPKDQKPAVFEKGIGYAKRGITLQDDCVDCHYWLGVNYSGYGEGKWVLKSLSLVEPIKDEMNKVIELDPNFNKGAAYRMLGRVAYKLPWFVGGSKKDAVAYLQKALEIGPNSLLTRVFLAETYLAMKKRDLAKKELEWVLRASDNDDPADREHKEKAAEIYQNNF
jgi:tetratricopeptide (TPR) repeat protein